MSKINETDDNGIIFDAKNFYYIGNYMSCINTIVPEQLAGSPELLSYLYLSYLAIDSGRIISSEIKENNPTALIAFRYLNTYLLESEKREEILQYFINKIQQNSIEDDTIIWFITSAIVFLTEGLHENVLKAIHNSENLECMALTIQCLIKINRIDLAKQVLIKMQEKNDDATLTQLSQAWINITCGGEQLQDAYHIFQEFCDKFNSTPLLLNGQAVCYIGQEKYEEAEDVLKEALQKKHNDYDTLVNLAVLSHLTGRNVDVINRFFEQIKQYYPTSGFVMEMTKKEHEFDRLCLQYEPTKKSTVNSI